MSKTKKIWMILIIVAIQLTVVVVSASAWWTYATWIVWRGGW